MPPTHGPQALREGSGPWIRTPWFFILGAGAVVVAVATAGADRALTAAALVLQLVFVVYFLRHLGFAIAAMRSAPVDAAVPLPPGAAWLPPVTVAVACKNEEVVVDGLIDSLLSLDYPAERLQVVVVDDGSTDATATRLAARASADARLTWLSRPPGSAGGKAAVLNAAAETAVGEVIVVFDADHRPRPDTIRRLVRHFRDPAVGAVQGRCVIRNADDAPLTRLVAIDYLAGYLVNEYGRQSLFHLPAYGGANCAVRTASLRRAGGWNAASVTEDTDLTLRLVLAGERVRYDVSAVDEEEGVVTFGRYWRQRYRWARGHQQVWRDYRSAVWRSARLTWPEKLETTLFLLVYHLPVVSAAGLAVLALWLFGIAEPSDPLQVYVLWTLLFLGPLMELGGALLIAGSSRRETLVLVLFLPVFFVAIALCTKAWVDGILGRPYSWVKTARAADASPVAAS